MLSPPTPGGVNNNDRINPGVPGGGGILPHPTRGAVVATTCPDGLPPGGGGSPCRAAANVAAGNKDNDGHIGDVRADGVVEDDGDNNDLDNEDDDKGKDKNGDDNDDNAVVSGEAVAAAALTTRMAARMATTTKVTWTAMAAATTTTTSMMSCYVSYSFVRYFGTYFSTYICHKQL